MLSRGRGRAKKLSDVRFSITSGIKMFGGKGNGWLNLSSYIYC